MCLKTDLFIPMCQWVNRYTAEQGRVHMVSSALHPWAFPAVLKIRGAIPPASRTRAEFPE